MDLRSIFETKDALFTKKLFRRQGMGRTQLFVRAGSILVRSGSLWAVALAVALVNWLAGQLISGMGIGITILSQAVSVATYAFLTGALIRQVNAISDGQAVNAADAFRGGARAYLPMLLVGVILAIPTWLVGLVVNPIISGMLVDQLGPQAGSTPGFSALALSTLCLGLPLIFVVYLAVTLIVSALGVGAERAVALEQAGVGPALGRAWRLVKSKLSDYIVIGLIMLAIGLAAGVVLACPVLLISMGEVIKAGVNSDYTSIVAAMSRYSGAFSIVGTVVAVPFTILFSGVWTLAFRRWQGKDASALDPLSVPIPHP
jgi:hypothetical protein